MAAWTLTPELNERTVLLNDAGPRRQGEFVLCWAHHALRAHDNPALETAASVALQLDLPLLVYQGLGGRHRYNSDRHHSIILQSARDFADELAAVGQHLAFHLPQDPARPGPLSQLLERSAAVVSELYPVPPFRQWYRRHLEKHTALPWILVDASCILPMTLSEEAPTRAFRFRNKWREEIDRRVERGWKQREEWPRPFTGDVGFETFGLSGSLPDAIARCRIDHSVPAVSDTRGGSRAGYERWSLFLERGLDSYHRLRNDAALPQGVSRMSAYLHYGCVSPFRIAGDAATRGGEGADKFLDELLVWRELSHHFCFRSEALESLDALPGWARESLLEHQADPRELTFDWETLARGKTGNMLWDLAQRSLLRRGELHNNVRMTWGKGFLPWAQRASRGLNLMVDLNHRYALDGNDPNSYGGLLWCMGQFDRAFPPGPFFGKVRQRSISRHAARLDTSRYARCVSTPAGGKRLRIAVVGAGLAGLTAARILDDQGHEVIVMDKGRGAGGRMSTRRHEDYRFDHGAQYFTARDPRFLRHVYAWRERGLVDAWYPRIAVIDADGVEQKTEPTERFVAVPGMSAICSEMAGDLPDCRFGWTVDAVRRKERHWILDARGRDSVTADALLLAIPPEQTRKLVNGTDVDGALADVRMRPCWAVMAVFDRPLFDDFDAAFVNSGPLSWLARQASRPGRPQAEAWVFHASPEWSEDHLEASPEEVGDLLLEAVRALPGAAKFKAGYASAHRWRFALAGQSLQEGALWNDDRKLALAGDWCHGSRVEGAFLSGMAAAGRIMASA